MTHDNCPSCGGAVRFEYAALPIQVCEYCRTLLRKEGPVISELGQCAVLPFDVSVLQIGTRLFCLNESRCEIQGEIVGRVRWGWTDGSWNEWLLKLPDDSIRWIAEESGLYMVMRPVAANADQDKICREILDRGRADLGREFNFEGADYFSADVKTVRCVSSEGTLTEPVATGYKIRTIDFRNAAGGSLTYQIESSNGYFYVGRYVPLAEMRPEMLRDLDGWTQPNFKSIQGHSSPLTSGTN